MDRKKQIDEMAHEIRCLSYCKGYEDNRGCYIAPTCALCRSNRENNADQISKALYNAGYRKQNDVAKQIFDDIDVILTAHRISHFENLFDDKLTDEITELKKKYMEAKRK